MAKNYYPIICLSVVSKVYEKCFSNRLFGHLKICDIFLISSMVLDLLDYFHIFWQFYLIEMGTDRTFNRSEATRDVALGVSKAFSSVWHTGRLHQLKTYGTSGQILDLILSFSSNVCLLVVLHETPSLSFLVLFFATHLC